MREHARVGLRVVVVSNVPPIVGPLVPLLAGLGHETVAVLGSRRNPRDPPLPPAAQFGGRGQQPPPGAPPGAGGQAPAGGRGGPNQGPVSGTPGFYKLVDTNGDDVMDTIERIQRYTSHGMGDPGPHAIRRAPDGSLMLLIGNNTDVGAPFAPGEPIDAAVDTESSPNWHNSEERQFLPQFNDPRFGNSTRLGVHATVWRLLNTQNTPH